MLRLATREDIPQLMWLCELAHAEYPEQTFPLDREKAAATFPTFIDEDRSKRITVVYEEGGQIVGAIIGFISEVFYSSETQSYELLWYVHPLHRKSRAALGLFHAYEYWAKSMGVSAIQASYVHSDAWPDLSKFYRRRGYKLLETSFRLSLTNGN